MSKLKELKSVKEKVQFLITEYPHLRDNDNKLIANVWHNEVDDTYHMNVNEFLSILSQGKLTSAESICRARRLLQAEFPELRGEFYKHKMIEEVEVRTGINKLLKQ